MHACTVDCIGRSYRGTFDLWQLRVLRHVSTWTRLSVSRHNMELGESTVDAATGQKAPKKVGRKRKRSEVEGEDPGKGDELINIGEKNPKRKVGTNLFRCLLHRKRAAKFG